jgi:hypothetical protein
MRAEGVDASTMAAEMAQAEASHPLKESDGVAALHRAQVLRHQAMLALNEAILAQSKLVGALRTVVEDGTGIDVDGLPYPDDEALFDMAMQIDVAHSNMARWFASLEGKETLARLMVYGPSAALVPVRHVMVAADGHCWEFDGHAEFDQGVRERFEREHGELLRVELRPSNADDPNSLQHVKCGDIKLLTTASTAREWAELHALILAERAKAAQQAVQVRLIDVLSGDRFAVTPHGLLFGAEKTWPDEWPDRPLHRLFPRNSPEPGPEVARVWPVGSNGLTNTGDPFCRVVRDRRDHDCDLWSDSVKGTMVWSHLNSEFELVDNNRFVRPTHA